MINLGPYSFSILTAVMAVVAVMWLLALLGAVVLPAAKKGLRGVDLFVIVLTVAFGAAWFAGMLYSRPAAASGPVEVRAQSCVTVKTGQSELKVRELMGEPDEIRAEEEVRGPGADVWIYRNSRCAVHTLSGSVISVE